MTNHQHCDSYGQYLRQIGRTPLLSDEEEVTLGRQVQAYMALKSLKAALQDQAGAPPTPDEWAIAAGMTIEEVDRVVATGERAVRRMMEANLRLVCAVAKKYLRRNVEILDLVQEGNLGLARAVEKFDPGKGYRFSTYAYWWIRQAMTRTIHNDSRSIRLPIHVSETLTMARVWVEKYSAKHGHPPNREELVTYLRKKGKLRVGPNGTLEDAIAMLDWYWEISRSVRSLNYSTGEDDGGEVIDFMADDGQQPDDFVLDNEMRDMTDAAIARLPFQQQQVIRLRFGFDDGKPRSLEQVGQHMGGLSRERVRQIQNIAMRNLRRDTRESGAIELVTTA